MSFRHGTGTPATSSSSSSTGTSSSHRQPTFDFSPGAPSAYSSWQPAYATSAGSSFGPPFPAPPAWSSASSSSGTSIQAPISAYSSWQPQAYPTSSPYSSSSFFPFQQPIFSASGASFATSFSSSSVPISSSSAPYPFAPAPVVSTARPSRGSGGFEFPPPTPLGTPYAFPITASSSSFPVSSPGAPYSIAPTPVHSTATPSGSDSGFTFQPATYSSAPRPNPSLSPATTHTFRPGSFPISGEAPSSTASLAPLPVSSTHAPASIGSVASQTTKARHAKRGVLFDQSSAQEIMDFCTGLSLRTTETAQDKLVFARDPISDPYSAIRKNAHSNPLKISVTPKLLSISGSSLWQDFCDFLLLSQNRGQKLGLWPDRFVLRISFENNQAEADFQTALGFLQKNKTTFSTPADWQKITVVDKQTNKIIYKPQPAPPTIIPSAAPPWLGTQTSYGLLRDSGSLIPPVQYSHASGSGAFFSASPPNSPRVSSGSSAAGSARPVDSSIPSAGVGQFGSADSTSLRDSASDLEGQSMQSDKRREFRS